MSTKTLTTGLLIVSSIGVLLFNKKTKGLIDYLKKSYNENRQKKINKSLKPEKLNFC